MKFKKRLTQILLYAAFAFIPIWPYFTYSELIYTISRYCYLILGWLYLGLLIWIMGNLIIKLGELLTGLVQSREIIKDSPENIPHRSNWRSLILIGLVSIGAIAYFVGTPAIVFIPICIGISWALVSLFMNSKSKNKQIENRLFRTTLILFGLSTIGFFGGSTLLTYTQMYKFNSIVKKLVLYEAKNGGSPINLEELNLDDKIGDSPLYSIRFSSLSLSDENCKAKFTYKTAILFDFDTDCDVKCCLDKPKGPPYEFIANGYADYKWYRFCSH